MDLSDDIDHTGLDVRASERGFSNGCGGHNPVASYYESNGDPTCEARRREELLLVTSSVLIPLEPDVASNRLSRE